jgi:hypothetical protein
VQQRREPDAQKNGAPALLTVLAQRQRRFQRSPAPRPRQSNDTARTMRQTRIASNSRYNPENMVAYQAGNAAKVAPAATTSQTSLPSHTGPIVSITAWRSSSSRPIAGASMPTPKSKPSSTK